MSADKYARILYDEKTGKIAVDIEMPEGDECDGYDAALRVAMVALGVAPESDLDDIKKTAVPDGTPTKVKQ